MRICIVDGRGGGLGSRLVEHLIAAVGHTHEIFALGTNRAAAEAMAKAGAMHIVVGEWGIVQTIREADLILGSLSIVCAGSFLGEVTPGVANAILQAPGRKLLLPLNRLGVEVIGVNSPNLEPLITQAVRRVQTILH
ncbi:MAG TPA: DUF3842 family protein [Nitrospiraceae bacterium]|nr:DUF3842 family protein [Nitrospiraceae bacterium]